MTGGVIALTFFAVLAPMMDDPTGRLLALDASSPVSTEEAFHRDASSAQAFELTPTMLGPSITDDMLILAEQDGALDEDWSVMTMPELEVRALPPIAPGGSAPPG